VHFVIDNVAGGAEVDGVNYFVVAVVFIAVEVFGLAAVAWLELVSNVDQYRGYASYLNSERITSRLAVRP
jgi:hypothetical protein